MNVLKCLSWIIYILSLNFSCSFIENLSSNRRGISIDDTNSSCSSGFNIFSFLLCFIHQSQIIISCFFLVGYFCCHDCSFVNIWKINFQKHESSHRSVSLLQIIDQSAFYFFTYIASLFPVIWSSVVPSYMKDTVSCYFCKNWFVVVLQKPVHFWQVLLY